MKIGLVLPLGSHASEPDPYPDVRAFTLSAEAAGFVWVRQTFLWEAIEPEQGAYEWETYDRIVRAVNQHEQLKLVAVIDGTPAWARASLAAQGYQFSPPASPEQYAIFAQQFPDLRPFQTHQGVGI